MNSPWMLLPVLAIAVAVLWSVFKKPPTDYMPPTGVKLACTYSYKRILPGIEGMDWVGLDDYSAGSGVLIGDAWQHLMARLRPDQRCYVVPGGAAPWHQDPEAFRRYAHATPQCLGIMAFMWGARAEADGARYEGIASSPVRAAYAALGAEIVKLGGCHEALRQLA